MRRAGVALAVLLLAAGGAGLVSVRHVREQLAVLAACEAAAAGDWEAALAGSAGRVGEDGTGRAAAQCRCRALLATGAGDACGELLERLDDGAWVPDEALAVHWIQTRRDAGEGEPAAALARRAARAHPGSADLFYLELVTRSGVEDERAVLRELEARVPEDGAAAARMRASLANRHLRRGDPAAALAALGASPPQAPDAARVWFETRGLALAMAGDLAGVRRSYADWQRAGGDPAELTARYALTLSIAGLREPDVEPVAFLAGALAASASVEDAALREALATRLVLTLVAADRFEDAIAVYERHQGEFDFPGLSREELARAAELGRPLEPGAAERSGGLRFALARPLAGATLWLSPGPDAPVDAEYERFEVPQSGRLSVRRPPGVAPQRWVLRNARGHTRASGTVMPRAGETREIAIRPGAPLPPGRARLARRPGDGRRRVAVLLLDCADWRLVRYLRARGELPVLGALLESGWRAVLGSDPPHTAAALEALVWPERRSEVSLLGLVHQLGDELAGLSSVGENPFGALSWLLPEHADLFSVLGAGRLRAANLLFAHGGMRAGRHSEVTGPEGRTRRVPLAVSERDLDAAERARWPALAGPLPERDAVHVRTIAAELDVAEELVREGAIDLLFLRVEPLDILTHAHFARAVRDGQDDGRGLLFSVYRYIDARLAAVHDALDADDVLVVMSDHGIRTAMEHSRHALFVATGAGIPHGRAAGRPDLRGVPRVLADWLGVDTRWPDTGVAPPTRSFARHSDGPAARGSRAKIGH